LSSGGVPIKPSKDPKGGLRGWNGHAGGVSLCCCHNALNDQIHRGGWTEQSRWDSDICVGDFVIYYTDVVGDDIHYLSRGERREANDA
jgi:hypothetical protein